MKSSLRNASTAFSSPFLGSCLIVLFLCTLPVFVRSSYFLTILIFIGLHTILTAGLCLLIGYAGQISLGHAAFYGIGAYTSAIATTRFGISPWLGILLAMALNGAIAFLVARPIFKLQGHYLAMATLGFGYIVYIFFTEATGLTGGPSGLTGIPYLSIGNWQFDQDSKYYYLVCAAAILVLLSCYNIVNSRVGRALRAINVSEEAAQSVGVGTHQLKAQIFTVSAVYAGLAGSLYAHYVTFVNPSPFGFHFSVTLLVMATVGGISTIWGAPIGAAVITLLTEGLRAVIPMLANHVTGEYEIIAFGVLLMVVMIFMPQGVVLGVVQVYKNRKARKVASVKPYSHKVVLDYNRISEKPEGG